MRVGILSSQTINLINEKVLSYQNNTSINTTYICGFRHEADSINNLICGFLPIFENISSGSLMSVAVDYLNNIECEPKEYDKQFRHHTNLPSELTIREGAR
ncbi:unnamed protein product [Rhizophagus irregularis]|uniref:Uncharacterized protein n=1 Tax=Rhizophagus irregularis TaxID=588596 RepID=A0A915YV68_9GLOM|nr:unnamed protein product [Rhizophagus irregularis]